MATKKRATAVQADDAGYVRGGMAEFTERAAANTRAARAGDTNAARAILRDFVGAIRQHTPCTWRGPIHLDYARYIADAFGQILEGNDAALALGTKISKSGRRKGVKTYDDEALAAAYWYLIRCRYSPEEANLRLRARLGADRRTVQRIAANLRYKAFSVPDLIDDDLLKQATGRYAAFIDQILAADAGNHR